TDLPRPPSFTLFPYTTLLRSHCPLTRITVYGHHSQSQFASDPHAPCSEEALQAHPIGRAHGARAHAVCRLFGKCALRTCSASVSDRKSTRLNSSHVKNSYAVF